MNERWVGQEASEVSRTLVEGMRRILAKNGGKVKLGREQDGQFLNSPSDKALTSLGTPLPFEEILAYQGS
jgi:hypothetical protein